MTIQECYEAIGGNYKDVLGRLQSVSTDPEIHIKVP